jgi:formate dehydrogenase major subunit
VAVVGGGPAGLTAARELSRLGHAVTLWEADDRLGGMMQIGIPHFRLPRDVLDAEIEAITAGDRIDVQLGRPVGEADVNAWLAGDEFDAVLLAAGAHLPRKLKLPGLDDAEALDGLAFMRAYNRHQPPAIEGPVVVVGGGFTAVDCARSAQRILGPDGEVAILYRRGEEQMTAPADELREIREEGITIDTLVSPVAVKLDDAGRLSAVTFRRNTLGEVEAASAKPRVIPVEGSEYDVPCRTLIAAIGQSRTTGVMDQDVETTGCRTGREGLYVCGDFAFGSEAIIDAVADAKAAVDEIDADLMGRQRRVTYLDIREADDTGRVRDHDLIRNRPMPTLPVDQRTDNREVELGLAGELADDHAWRCYLCSYKYEIDQDKCIHCDWCIKVSPRNCILRLASLETDDGGQPVRWEEVPPDDPSAATYIWIDSDQCIRCGNCIRKCPTDAISLRKADLATECTP